jgi:subtilisin family serine protease
MLVLLCSLQSNPSEADLNARGAWSQGYTGRGVVVTILDDGIEKDHPDLASNYVSTATTTCSVSIDGRSTLRIAYSFFYITFFLPSENTTYIL